MQGRFPQNFLHDHPDLYDAVIPESQDHALAQFALDVVRRHAPGPKVLDVGCGPGRELAYLRSHGAQADGLDASIAMVERARQFCPGAEVTLGLQAEFRLPGRYDAILCFGSTFLYNHSWRDIKATLENFAGHLNPGGLLAMEMRNAAYFLTAEGQATLGVQEVHKAVTDHGALRFTSELALDPANQLLDRYYRWEPEEAEPVVEQLRHRLIFPEELRLALDVAGFEVIDMFDRPIPAGGELLTPETVYSRDLRGFRLHVLARLGG